MNYLLCTKPPVSWVPRSLATLLLPALFPVQSCFRAFATAPLWSPSPPALQGHLVLYRHPGSFTGSSAGKWKLALCLAAVKLSCDSIYETTENVHHPISEKCRLDSPPWTLVISQRRAQNQQAARLSECSSTPVQARHHQFTPK